MSLFKNLPSEDTPINARNLSRSERYLEAVAGANGDFYVDIDGADGLEAGDILRISFPTATNGASNARLSIDGVSGTYIGIKDNYNNVATGNAAQNLKLSLVYDGTDFIFADFPNWTVVTQTITPNNEVTIAGLKDKNEVYVYYTGAFNERMIMYYNKNLTNNSVYFNTSRADGTNLKRFGLLVDFSVGKVRNDNLSTSNISKIMYR